MASTINASTTLGLISTADTSGVLQLQTANTAALTINASQNVGVGTASPANKLHVNGTGDSGRFQGTSRSLYIATDTNASAIWNGAGQTGEGVYLNAASNQLDLYTNSTVKVRIDASGNLGLGVTPSASTLSGIIEGGYGTFGLTSSIGVALAGNAYYNSGWKYKASSTATLQLQDSGGFKWNVAASGTAGNTISFTQAMTLTASGFLGVATTSPQAPIHAVAATTVGTDSSYAIIAGDSASTNRRLLLGYTGSGNGYGVIQGVVTGTAWSDVVICPNAGNVLVGTVATGITNVSSVNLEAPAGRIIVNHPNGSASGSNYVVFGYNTSNIGSITQNGTTGVLYNLTSDYRLKNNPEALTGAKDFVMALQPKKWQWWDGSGEGVGFIAHEFMEVAKYSGTGTKDAMDEEGKPVMQSIQPSSSEVMANLVSHIQNLETRLAALEGN